MWKTIKKQNRKRIPPCQKLALILSVYMIFPFPVMWIFLEAPPSVMNYIVHSILANLVFNFWLISFPAVCITFLFSLTYGFINFRTGEGKGVLQIYLAALGCIILLIWILPFLSNNAGESFAT